MTSLDIETKRKLREMGATPLLDAFTAQDEALVLGMGFSERIALIVDEATPGLHQYAKKDWHQRLGSGVHADAIMDRIVHNTIWIETGDVNMREHTATNS